MNFIRNLLFITALLHSITIVCSQTLTQTVRGTVTDKDSRIPLPGANITVEGALSFLGASTDMDGNFKIESVPVGRHSFKVTSLGYETKIISNVLAGSGKEVVLNIEMTESVIGLKEVEVRGDTDRVGAVNEMSVVSARTFSVEETNRYAGSWNDPARMASAFAGVNGGNDEKDNDIIIRGNSPKGLLWTVEGVEVPSPNHFSEEGASSGSVSILSSNMLANSDFLTGAFPAEYGNALSGVFDIRLSKGNDQKREFALEASIIGLDFSMEGPFIKGKRASYLANYRYSTLALVPLMGIDLQNALPVFQDFSFKVYAPTKQAGTFSVFGIGGKSSLRYKEDGEREDGTHGLKYDEELGSDMMATGISHNYIINKKTYIKSTLAFTAQDVRYNEKRHYSKDDYIVVGNQRYINYAGKAMVTINNKFNSRHQLRSGIIYSHLFFDLLSEDYSIRRQILETEVKDDGHTDLVQAYTSWRFRISETFAFTAGMNGMFFLLNNNFTVEPRASVQWQFKPKQTLSFGAGLHSRMDGLSVYLNEVKLDDETIGQPNHDLDFTKAAHFVLGYDYRFTKNLHLKTEVYYQYLFNVPIENDDSSSFSSLNRTHGFTRDALVNDGTGENYGIELTLEKFFADNYFFLVTGSFYNSKFTAADGIKQDTRFNNHFITNVLGGKEFIVGRRSQNLIGLSARATVAGGIRYVPVDEEESTWQGYYVEDEGVGYSEQAPLYHRFDFAIYYTKNKKRAAMTWKLDIQNIANHANIQDVDVDPERGLVFEKSGQLLPVFSYKLEF